MTAIQFLVGEPKPVTEPGRLARLRVCLQLGSEIILYLLDEEEMRLGTAEDRTHLLERFNEALRVSLALGAEPALTEYATLFAVTKIYLAHQEHATRTPTLPAPAGSES